MQQFSVHDIREQSAGHKKRADDLASRVDAIDVHFDMDVLAAKVVPGRDLSVADGVSNKIRAAAMTLMFKNPKTVTLGIASTGSFNLDPDGVSRQAALNLFQDAIGSTQAPCGVSTFKVSGKRLINSATLRTALSAVSANGSTNRRTKAPQRH